LATPLWPPLKGGAVGGMSFPPHPLLWLDCAAAEGAVVQPSLVDVYVSYVRRKLKRPGRPDPIRTVRGVGYRLEPQDV
jgi:Transcriptional regulatory protein, C terminal